MFSLQMIFSCLRRQIAVQGDHVRGGEQRVQLDVFADGAAGVGGEDVIGQHAHAERLCDAAGRLANAAEADDADRLMLELNERVIPEAPVGAAGPAAGMDSVAVVADVVAGLEQQGDGILADRGGAVGRDVADGDAALPGAGDIHDVVARGQHADHFDVGAGLEDRPRQRRLVGQHDLGVRDARDRLRGICQARPVIDRHLRQLPQPIPAQIAGIFRITIQNHKFHVPLSFRQNPRRLPCAQLALILSQTGGFFCMNLIFYRVQTAAYRGFCRA